MANPSSSKLTVDLYKERPDFFRARAKPELVDLPEAGFLVVDGAGDPGGADFQDAVGALYAVAYTVKMTGKKEGRDFKVPTFTGSWSIFDQSGKELPREQWRWRLAMMVPDFVGEADVAAALQELERRKRSPNRPVRYERVREGQCVQVMHRGPYDSEGPSIEKLNAFIAEHGLRARGPHQEVYLSDPRRGKPENTKTILRWPVGPA